MQQAECPANRGVLAVDDNHRKTISRDGETGSFVAANDGSVRWKQFRKDTFYAFEIVGFWNNPVTEGEELYHFYPYELGLEMGLYNWRVWSPSMFDDMDYPGFHGAFEVE